MAYSILNFVETDSGSLSQASIDAPNFTASAGSALVAFIWNVQGPVTVTMSDTVGSNDSWTKVTADTNDGTNYYQAYYLLNASSGSCTVRASFSFNIDYPCLAVVEVSGIATSSAFAGSAAASQSSPGTGSNAITTGNTGTLTGQPAAILAMVQNIDTDSCPAAGTDFTSQDSYRAWDYGGGTFGGRFEHRRVTATTAVAGTFTDSTNGGSSPYQTIVVAMLESGGSSQSNAPRAAHQMKLMGAM